MEVGKKNLYCRHWGIPSDLQRSASNLHVYVTFFTFLVFLRCFHWKIVNVWLWIRQVTIRGVWFSCSNFKIPIILLFYDNIFLQSSHDLNNFSSINIFLWEYVSCLISALCIWTHFSVREAQRYSSGILIPSFQKNH